MRLSSLESATCQAGRQAGRTSAANAEETLAALRATYEPLLDGLAMALLLPLPSWIASEEADHWQRGHRGLIASRLAEELSSRSDSDTAGEFAAASTTGGKEGAMRPPKAPLFSQIPGRSRGNIERT
jgi:hypothetical protein